MVSKCLVGQNRRPLRVLAVRILEFADRAIDDQLDERGITQLSFLDRTRILDVEGIVARPDCNGHPCDDASCTQAEPRWSDGSRAQTVERGLGGQKLVSIH